MFAIADESISIQHLHYKRKYRYVKSTSLQWSLPLTDLEVKRGINNQYSQFSTLKRLVIMHEWVIILNNVKHISL